jgi:hypothetical protein
MMEDNHGVKARPNGASAGQKVLPQRKTMRLAVERAREVGLRVAKPAVVNETLTPVSQSSSL